MDDSQHKRYTDSPVKKTQVVTDSSESDLVVGLRKKSTRTAAFESLVTTFQKPLYRHLRRMLGNHPDADDALQNTFIKVWKNLDKFRGDSALYSWIYRIATNEALAMIERQKKRKDHLQVESQGLTASSDSPAAEVVEAKLQAALLTLPEKQRQVFDLKYFEEMKYEAIAEITGTSIGALKASYFHAVRKVEAYLTSQS